MAFKALFALFPLGEGLTKTLRIMRISLFFLLAGFLQVSARTDAQTVTLKVRNAPFVKVFHEIEKQTGYLFLYSPEQLDPTATVTLDLKDVSLNETLDKCFAGQAFSYEIINKTIVLKRVKVAAPEVLPLTLEERPVIDVLHGRVTDSAGNPLAGASVTVKGGKRGTQTNAKGEFELRGVEGKVILVVSFTGYASREYKVSGESVVNISLSRSVSPLDAIQIIAYGSQSQRLSVSNVTTVSSEEISRQPVADPISALEGRVPGLFITSDNGMPGAAVSVFIQGQNSIANGNDPFYIVDGVPYSSSVLPNNGQIFGLSRSGYFEPTGASPFNYLNPSDIESISVLKDAAATAIYGSQAANGAILITTKKGKQGKSRIDVDLQNGWSQVSRKLDLMNTRQYLEMRHEALANDGATVSAQDYDLNGVWDSTRNTDWQKVLLGNTAQYTDLSGSISGGNTNTQYLAGGTYNRQTTVFPGNFYDRKASVHFSLNTFSTNRKLHFTLGGNYLLDDDHLPSVDLTRSALNLAPDAPPLFNKDGSINWQPTPSGTSSFNTLYGNPAAQMSNFYNKSTANLVSNAVLGYEISPGLELKGNFGYTNQQINEVVTYPITTIEPEYRATASPSSLFTYNRLWSWIIEPQLTYHRLIGKGRLDALAGVTIRQNNGNGLVLMGYGYNSDAVLTDLHAATNIVVNSTTIFMYKYNALFGRLNYNWDEQYLLDLTVRRDGSSRFGSANEFHDFGAVGAGWVFTRQPWVGEHLSFLSFGKLKASYGLTGNDQIGDYSFLSLYNPLYIGVPYMGGGALVPNGLSNPHLQWEETRKLNIGLNLGFLKDRIVVEADYALNRSSNQLLGYALPSVAGFSSVNLNFPATVQNTSLELSVHSTNIRKKDFEWSTNLVMTVPRNKLAAFPALDNSSYSYNLIVGKPVQLTKRYRFLGVDPATGVYEFKDSHGNATGNPDFLADQTALFDLSPRYYGSIENNFTYKNWRLVFSIQGTKQLGYNSRFGNSSPGGFNYNEPTYVLDRWRSPGDQRPIQRYNANYSLVSQQDYANGSDAAISDASFLRLKNISLSYDLSAKSVQRAGLQSCQVFLHAENLFTYTGFQGLNPQNPYATAVPTERTLTVGLQVGF